MEELTGFQRDCLYVLNDLGKAQGSEIRTELERYYEQHIQAAILYPSLDDLVKQGFIKKGSRDPRRDHYTLAPTGKHELIKYHSWKEQNWPDEMPEVKS